MRIHRRLALISAAAVVFPLLVSVQGAAPAFGHGAMLTPATRTYACFVDGKAGGNGGDLNPTNPACADAVAQGGKQPLWDWFGLLIGDVAGQHRERIRDGELCGASTTKYAAYNMARLDWPTTTLQSGAQHQFRFNAWANHPGTWFLYVTRDGFDPTQPLRWSDLDPLPFNQVTNPPLTNGPTGAEYWWNGTLPVKSGRHIIYTIWQRSDSPESFYNCSDVNFTGGPGPGPTTTGPTTTNPGPTTTGTTTTTTTAPGAIACSATYTLVSSWSNGFHAEVTVRNNGTRATRLWNVNWSFPNGQTVAQVWNGSHTPDGQNVAVTNTSWNGTIQPGGSTTFGLLGNGAGPNTPPATVFCNAA